MGNGRLRKGREDLFRSGDEVPSGIAVEMADPVFDMPSLGALEESGEFMLQNIPSVACGHVLNPKVKSLLHYVRVHSELLGDFDLLDWRLGPGYVCLSRWQIYALGYAGVQCRSGGGIGQVREQD